MFISFANLTQDENFYVSTFFLWESYENLTFYDIGRVKIQGRKQTVGKKTKKNTGCSEKFLLLRCTNNTLLYNLIFIRKK
jgi:hypothetical protein